MHRELHRLRPVKTETPVVLPQPATALRTGVPMELEQIIHKILAKNPDERYQHADDLIVDLKRVYNVLETSAKIPITTSKIETIPKAPKSFKKYLVTAAAIVLLVIAYLLIKPLIVKEVAVAGILSILDFIFISLNRIYVF